MVFLKRTRWVRQLHGALQITTCRFQICIALGSSWTLWDALEALGHSGALCDALGCSGTLWDALGWDALGLSVILDALGCSGTLWAALGCSG